MNATTDCDAQTRAHEAALIAARKSAAAVLTKMQIFVKDKGPAKDKREAVEKLCAEIKEASGSGLQQVNQLLNVSERVGAVLDEIHNMLSARFSDAIKASTSRAELMLGTTGKLCDDVGARLTAAGKVAARVQPLGATATAAAAANREEAIQNCEKLHSEITRLILKVETQLASECVPLVASMQAAKPWMVEGAGKLLRVSCQRLDKQLEELNERVDRLKKRNIDLGRVINPAGSGDVGWPFEFNNFVKILEAQLAAAEGLCAEAQADRLACSALQKETSHVFGKIKETSAASQSLVKSLAAYDEMVAKVETERQLEDERIVFEFVILNQEVLSTKAKIATFKSSLLSGGSDGNAAGVAAASKSIKRVETEKNLAIQRLEELQSSIARTMVATKESLDAAENELRQCLSNVRSVEASITAASEQLCTAFRASQAKMVELSAAAASAAAEGDNEARKTIVREHIKNAKFEKEAASALYLKIREVPRGSTHPAVLALEREKLEMKKGMQSVQSAWDQIRTCLERLEHSKPAVKALANTSADAHRQADGGGRKRYNAKPAMGDQQKTKGGREMGNDIRNKKLNRRLTLETNHFSLYSSSSTLDQ
eukprot:GHVT01012179.1.p1 GENE.GHVT01012179.1~~GHVT01012179.1.p1  ORF type:complete len:644 (-),score=175.64 GHVT01012179.1:542-2344(-)